MNKTYLSFLILLFLSNVSFSTNTVSVINHSSFPNVPQSSFDTETTKFCLMFRGVTPLTNSIILSANGSSEALQDYIDKTSIVLYNELFANASFELGTDETTNIVLHLFSQHREDEFMRLCFETKKRITFSIGITLASSHKDNKIVHADLEKFAQFTYYNLNSDQVVGLTVMADEANDSLKLNSTFKFTVDLSFNFASDKKVILGDKVCLRFSMDNVEISDSIESSSMPTLNPDTNQLENKLTFDKINVGNYRVLCNFKEDLSKGRAFRLYFSNLKFNSCGTGDYKFKAELLWKNTNSIIGKNEVDMGLSCLSYTISSGKIEHTSKMKKLFINTNWPVIITFKPDESFSDKTITINGPTGINFLQATCFVESNGTNSICSSSKGSNDISVLKIQKAIATKGVDYRIRIWIDAVAVVTSGFKYTVSIDGFSSLSITSSFEILDAITNFSEVYNFSLINSKDEAHYLSSLTSTTSFQIRENFESLNVVDLPKQFFSITSEGATRFGNYNMFFPLGYTTINKDKTLKYIQLKAEFTDDELVSYPDSVNYSQFLSVDSSSFDNSEAKNSIYLNSPTINTDLQGISFKNYITNGTDLAKIYLFKYFQTYPICPEVDRNVKLPCVDSAGKKVNDNPTAFAALSFDIKFSDFVTLKKYDQNYYYGDFDFITTFTSKDNSTVFGYKRYVSLIGMTSGFSSYNSEEKIKVSFLKTTTSSTPADYPGIKNSICILEIDFTNLVTDTSGLIGMFLYGLNPLNFEKMSSYPVQGSNIIARVGYEVDNLHTLYNNLDLYVHSSMQFPLSTTLSTVFVPVSCFSATKMTLNFFNYNFTSGKYVAKTNYITIIKNYTTETSNKKFKIVSQSAKTVKCKKFYEDDKFYLEVFNEYDADNVIDSDDSQIVSFSFLSQKPANLVKLCNASNEDLTIDSRKYITFTDNKLLLNSNTYLSGIIFFNNILDPAVKLGYISGTGLIGSPRIANVKICPGQNLSAENLGQALLAMSFIKTYSTEVLANFKSEVNSTYCPLQEITPSQFDSKVLKITINTTKIKLPVLDTMVDGNNYICATYSVKPRINTKKIVITMDGIITKDHTQCKNFGIANEEILVDNDTIEIRRLSTNLNNINFSCCNIELIRTIVDEKTIQTVEVKNLRFYDGDDIIYNYVKDTDPSIIKDIIKAENKDQQAAKVTRATFSGAASYSSLTLDVQFDHEVFYNMRFVVNSSELDRIIIDQDIPIKCTVSFINDTDRKNKIFETCNFDQVGKEIIVTTNFRILSEVNNFDSVVRITLTPVKVVNLNNPNSEWIVTVGFNNSNISSYFPEKIFPLTSASSISTSQICTISPKITDISPKFPGINGCMKITIDDSSSETFKACNDKFSTSPIVNEITFYFPYLFFGAQHDQQLECKINKITVTNCVFLDGWINVRASLNINNAIVIDVCGFQIMTEYPLTKFLTTINQLTSSSRTVYYEGIGTKHELLATNFPEPITENKLNIAIISQEFTNTIPGVETDTTLKFVVDEFQGLYGSNYSYHLKSINLYVESNSYFPIPAFKDTTEFKLEENYSITVDNVTSNVDRTHTCLDADKALLGQTFSCILNNSADNDFKLEPTSRYFKLTVKRMNLNLDRQGVFNIVLVNEGLYFSTFETMRNNDFDTIDPLPDKLKSEMFVDFRTIKPSNTLSKMFLSYSRTLTSLIPGTYGPFEITVKYTSKVDKIDVLKQTIKLTILNSNFLTPQTPEFILDGLNNKFKVMWIGMPCDTIPGKYFLSFGTTTAALAYYDNPTPVIGFVKYKYDKTPIKFYNSDLVEVSTSQILVPLNGRVMYKVATLTRPSVTDLRVECKIKPDSGTTIKEPSVVIIPSASTSFINNKFDAISSSITDLTNIPVQLYTCSASGNTCFESTPELKFKIDGIVPVIPSTIKLGAMITMFDNTSDTKLNLNELKFIFSDASNEIPNGSTLFCSLMCAERAVTKEDIMTLPQPVNNWNEVFYNFAFDSGETKEFKATDLARDVKYKLNCYLKSSSLDEKAFVPEINLLTIGDKTITPIIPEIFFCIRLSVSEKSDEFKLEAQKVIQEFLISNSQSCAIVYNDKNIPLDVFNQSYTCEPRKKSEIAKIEKDKRNRFRFLQGTPTPTPTPTPNPIIENSYDFCLKQLPTCRTNSQAGKVREVITNLFKNSDKRTLQTGTLSNIFASRLSANFKSLFKSINIIDVAKEMVIDKASITILNQSDMSIDKNFAVAVKYSLKSKYTEDYLCDWGLTKNTSTTQKQISTDFTACSIGKNDVVICGTSFILKANGLETIINKPLAANDLKSYTDLGLWLTCRQNIFIARDNSIPIKLDSLSINFTYEEGVCFDNKGNCVSSEPDPVDVCKKYTDDDETSENENFPDCCPSKSASTEDETICSTSWLSTSLILLFSLLLMLLDE